MNQNQRCLIAIDLDDTVLSNLFSLSSASVATLIDAQSAGHVVMIATARPSCMALPYHRAMGLHGPISTLNGAYLYHPDDPAFPTYRELISETSVAAISAAIKRAGITFAWMENDDDLAAIHLPQLDHLYFREVFRQSNVTFYPELPARPTGRIFAYADDRARAEAVLEEISACPDVDCRMYPQSGEGVRFNCAARTADKWYAVKHAAEWYGIAPENIITFGDQENDRKMLFNAGHGFVLCNGSAKLQEDAIRAGVGVTKHTCADGGVAWELKKLLF